VDRRTIFMTARVFSAAALVAFMGSCRGSTVAPVSVDAAQAPPATPEDTSIIYGLTVKRLDGSEVRLSAWAGKVLLVVNTASECGYTPQYEGLEALQKKYAARGFFVLGFPSNDFGEQEPGTSKDIAAFCSSKFGVTFPMFEKVDVVGASRSPLYALLSEAKGAPKWNFHKYLVDRKGRPVDAWPSAVEPSSAEIARAIERELALP
jgi:glutathione peroxidase